MKKKIIWKLNLYDIVNFTDLKITEWSVKILDLYEIKQRIGFT
jgi:hypothetical protein